MNYDDYKIYCCHTTPTTLQDATLVQLVFELEKRLKNETPPDDEEKLILGMNKLQREIKKFKRML